ncbi:hypothetical protein GCM10009757_52100 [Streptomyces cheonanensis]|uniref:Uncharacterized protein n=1 Tax=Streptomyces cheonanensis TaxID=312720 RepID=A0ABN2VLG7_9ACTN
MCAGHRKTLTLSVKVKRPPDTADRAPRHRAARDVPPAWEALSRNGIQATESGPVLRAAPQASGGT